jgi:hypothetical protein
MYKHLVFYILPYSIHPSSVAMSSCSDEDDGAQHERASLHSTMVKEGDYLAV